MVKKALDSDESEDDMMDVDDQRVGRKRRRSMSDDDDYDMDD